MVKLGQHRQFQCNSLKLDQQSWTVSRQRSQEAKIMGILGV